MRMSINNQLFFILSNSLLALIAIALDDEVATAPNKKKRFSVHSTWHNREQEGQYHTLYKELLDDETQFNQYFPINICKERNTKLDVMVECTRSLQVGKMLKERSIPFEVAVTACPGLTTSGPLRKTLSPILTHVRRKSPCKNSIDWNDFYPLEKVNDFLESIEEQYPSTCTVINIGKSVEGRDIKMLKISNSDAKNTGVWLDGAIHAREWISTSVVTYIADYIARKFDALGDSIINKDWYFVPVVNPDGYHHTFVGDRMWRKNRARFGNSITGVDLNRNFSYAWGRNAAEMSSGDPNHLNYRGPEPFSEPESTAIKDIILYSGTPFKIFLSFHAYSEVICFPWSYTPEPCPDYVSLLEGATCMAKAIYETNGRKYKVGNFKDIMYCACGTSIDWSYGTARIPFSYLVELRSKRDKFLLPKEEIKDCCKEICNGVLELAKFVEGKKCLNCTILGKK